MLATLFAAAGLVLVFIDVGIEPVLVAGTSTALLPGGANALQESYEYWSVNCAPQNGARRCSNPMLRPTSAFFFATGTGVTIRSECPIAMAYGHSRPPM
jgi:hypothetical protein